MRTLAENLKGYRTILSRRFGTYNKMQLEVLLWQKNDYVHLSYFTYKRNSTSNSPIVHEAIKLDFPE